MSSHGGRKSESQGSGSTHESHAEAETVAAGRPVDVDDAVAERQAGPGSSMGRYVVLEEVGRGGMGRVLRAYDPKLQREVALKEVRRELLGAKGEQRLVAEARAMAKLSHPNVVAVYDVEDLGEHGVVLVMEFVGGQTMREWLKETSRSWQELVHLFCEAGRGLAAAHAAGLLHRDFKPANVLVSETTVKVTDFGLAKVDVESSGSASFDEAVDTPEALTEEGVVLGTPRYMAPEQHRRESLTSAADQYAFCVALWEALCGKPPFSGSGAGAPSLFEQKQKGPPAWPDSATPRPIVEAIRRGLATEPTQRWASMDALIAALQYDPARQRNRWLMGLGGLGVVGLAAAGWQSWAEARASRCSGAQAQLEGVWDDARAGQIEAAVRSVDAPYVGPAWDRAKEGLQTYAAAWATMHKEACEATTIRAEQSAQVMDLRMACLTRAKTELQAVTDIFASPDPRAIEKAHELVGGLPDLSRCADVHALQSDVDPPSNEEAETVNQIRDRLAVARAAVRAGRYDEAQTEVDEAKAAVEGIEYGPVRTDVLLVEGNVLDGRGQYAEAEQALTQALESAAQFDQWTEMGDTATDLMFNIGIRQERPSEGLRYYELALGLTEENPRRGYSVLAHRGHILGIQGTYDEAESQLREALAMAEQALGADHPEVAHVRDRLATALKSAGKLDEALAEHHEALELRRALLGESHPNTGVSHANLGNVLLSQGKWKESEAQHREALRIFEAALAPDHPLAAAQRSNLAGALEAQGRQDDAEAELRRGLAQLEESLGRDHPRTASARVNLARILSDQGKYEAAILEAREALSGLEKSLGAEHPTAATARAELAAILLETGETQDAEAELHKVVSVRESALDEEHPALAQARFELAAVLVERGASNEARPVAEKAWARLQKEDTPPAERAATAFLLARILASSEQSTDRTKATELAKTALQTYEGIEPPEAGTKAAVLEVRAWLDSRE